ncbi:MAG TPA: Uma2 family endonuclease [Planctomycetaceae bacterium]|jgi:Uma2 family endonuclease|nr:Uma2 family endonuclease [Planctomycetaceae bacterium]
MSVGIAEPLLIESTDALFETINGVRVEKQPMGAYAVTIASELARLLGNFVNQLRLGLVSTEVLFLLNREPRQERRPDLSFVSRARMRGEPPPISGAWDVIPDLAVEVVSPTNAADEIEKKVTEYLDYGVQQVWVLYPESRRLYIHRSRCEVAVVGEDDRLSGGDLFPGLEFRLGDVFGVIDALLD